MLRVLVLTIGLCSAAAFTANAADDTKPERRKLTEEQQKVRKEIIEKYDKNKDGKLDREERAAMSAEDKDKLAKAGLGPRRKKEDSK